MHLSRQIVVRGAREHNLRNVDLELPHGQLICFSGVSGSGKSSLAFDTIYAEGQRRYLESLSSYARQFVGQLPKPDCDHLTGLSPSISISQKSTSQNPRSTVGTITEVYDFLRVLYARVGTSFCPVCHIPVTSFSPQRIVAEIRQRFAGREVFLLAPLIRQQKGQFFDLFDDLRRQGFNRARVDGTLIELADPPTLQRHKKHDIDLVVNRLTIEPLEPAVSSQPSKRKSKAKKTKGDDSATASADAAPNTVATIGQGDSGAADDALSIAVATAIRSGDGTLQVAAVSSLESAESLPKRRTQKAENAAIDNRGGEDDVVTYSTNVACPNCSLAMEPPSPQLLSFNSPQGMCPACHGLGQRASYDIDQLIDSPTKSIRGGAIELLGSWTKISKTLRRYLLSVAKGYEPAAGLGAGKLLATPWKRLEKSHQDYLLQGAAAVAGLSLPRNSLAAGFEGLLALFAQRYKDTNNPLLQRQHEKLQKISICPQCGGGRLNAQAANIRLRSDTPQAAEAGGWLALPQLTSLPLPQALTFIERLELDKQGRLIATEAIKEIGNRLHFLCEVGLEYLSLERTAPTLSGGEAQRIRLASQIGAGLVGVTYVLDEPSIGLHPRDNDKLIGSLKRLRDMGNTLLVVEHDADTMLAADVICDFGPGPGSRGGELIAYGSCDEIAASERSLTGAYLSGQREVHSPEMRRSGNGQKLMIRGARHHNLKGIDVEFPLGMFIAVTGVSGSGKSSLVTDILAPALSRQLMRGEAAVGEHDAIDGVEHLDKIIDIDQSPIGRTPRSNPATYVKVFDEIRGLYSQLTEAKRRGFAPGRFSFNTAGGRCGACEGNGSTRLDMEMMSDLWVECPVCGGKRFDRETLEVKFKEASIADVLDMDIQDALKHFENVPKVAAKLQTLHDVGLDYMKLGQPSPTLSGGEAQRIKLSRELSKRSTGRTIYVLDEPTTGLHFHDISMLLSVLQKLVDAGNTVVVVEHNLDLIQAADWVIDMGLEGGEGGGTVVCAGQPEVVAQQPASYTGAALRKYFADRQQRRQAKGKKRRKTKRSLSAAKTSERYAQLLESIEVTGASMHNLKNVSVTIPRDAMTVFCGRSGSGKTSLAIDTIYAEGQRRYVESLSSYARQFVGQAAKPKFERISGLSPAIALEQKNLSHTPRSTVGTVTEIYDYLRLMLARVATMYCPDCQVPISTQTVDQIVDRVLQIENGQRALILAPIVSADDYNEIELGDDFFDGLVADGFARVRIDGVTHAIADRPAIDPKQRHTVQIVVDRIVIDPSSRSRISDSVEQALARGHGRVQLALADAGSEREWVVHTYSQFLSCGQCGKSYSPLTPHHFSFNTRLGWCEACNGLGRRVGTNLDELIDGTRSLREGGVQLWPVAGPLATAMLETWCRECGIDADQPIGSLKASQRNQLIHGTGERKFAIDAASGWPTFEFEYRGVLPTLELAAKGSAALRSRLQNFVAEVECSDCSGSRVRPEAAVARFRDLTIVDLINMPLTELHACLSGWELTSHERSVVGEIVEEIKRRLSFLIEVGLDYLTLGRTANTLSGGEAQRIRLASQLGSGLCGVMYILDEPTIGLHPRDNHRLIAAMHRLRDAGNTLLVVEHDRDVIAAADGLCDFGPESGALGGQILAHGTVDEVRRAVQSVTGPYLSGRRGIAVPTNRRPIDRDDSLQWLTVVDAHLHTLRHIDVSIPLGRFVAVTGPSGSGKSSLINGILYPALANRLHRSAAVAGPHGGIRGLQHIDKVIRVDQSPLGNTPSSTPVTYTGVFDLIREQYSRLAFQQGKYLGSHMFSFNVPGGRCESCMGVGSRKIEMHFLPDVWVECESCHGLRYMDDILAIRLNGKNIYDVLQMSVSEAVAFFEKSPAIAANLRVLEDVGLGYLTLGQSAPTLSGGEAQRVKLAAELARPATGKTLYLLDEPTTGLHFDDITRLLEVLHRLVDAGNTVLVIEHNLDVIKTADWVIDMGPEAGWSGGQIVFAGTPEGLAEYASKTPKNIRGKKKRLEAEAAGAVHRISYTGQALRPVLEAGPREKRIAKTDAAVVRPTFQTASPGKSASAVFPLGGPSRSGVLDSDEPDFDELVSAGQFWEEDEEELEGPLQLLDFLDEYFDGHFSDSPRDQSWKIDNQAAVAPDIIWFQLEYRVEDFCRIAIILPPNGELGRIQEDAYAKSVSEPKIVKINGERYAEITVRPGDRIPSAWIVELLKGIDGFL